MESAKQVVILAREAGFINLACIHMSVLCPIIRYLEIDVIKNVIAILVLCLMVRQETCLKD